MCTEAGLIVVERGGDVLHAVYGEIYGLVEYGQQAVYREDPAGAGQDGDAVRLTQEEENLWFGSSSGLCVDMVVVVGCTILHYWDASGVSARTWSVRWSA